MSKKLIFLDIVQDEGQIQVMIDLKLLQREGDFQIVELESLRKRISIGDYYCMSSLGARLSTALTRSSLHRIYAPHRLWRAHACSSCDA